MMSNEWLRLCDAAQKINSLIDWAGKADVPVEDVTALMLRHRNQGRPVGVDDIAALAANSDDALTVLQAEINRQRAGE